MKIARVAIAAVVLSLASLFSMTGPATASVAEGTFCEPVGWTFHWKAKKFYDGEFYGYGPLRLRRSTAQRDCDNFMN